MSKLKCENHTKSGPKRCEMMRGFQIWPQNKNRISFDPLFAPKTVENRLNRVLRQLSTVFGPKMGKCYSIWILRPYFESSYHFASIWTPFDIIFTFQFFLPPMLLFTHKCGRGINFLENENFDELIVISVKNASDRWVRQCV